MKNIFILIIALIISYSANSQKVSPNTYVISFIDKDTSTYKITEPEKFLSEKAINRRQKYNIPITEQDLPINYKYVNKIKEMGFEIYASSKWMNHVVVYSEDSTLIEKAEQLDFIKKYEKNKNIKKKKAKKQKLKDIDVDVSPDIETVLDYGYGDNQVEMLTLQNLHNKGFMGQGMQIAILDAGFYHVDTLAGFDSIRTNNQILGIKDFVKRDSDVYEDATHGMNVLSTIAANLPGKLIGTAPKASFWLLRTENEHSETLVEEYYWLSAAEYADSIGVDMIHSSLGYNDFDDKSTNHTYEEMNGDVAICSIAADIASSKGILVVTSAGNEGNDPWHYISAPGDADSVLTIGAVTSSGNVSNFSSRGPSSDGRIKPDVMAQGSYVWVLGRRKGVTISSGTSFSGPIIAGAVACLWQANPQFSNMEIIDAVKKSSNRYSNPDEDYGYGIPNFAKADAYLKKLLKERKK